MARRGHPVNGALLDPHLKAETRTSTQALDVPVCCDAIMSSIPGGSRSRGIADRLCAGSDHPRAAGRPTSADTRSKSAGGARAAVTARDQRAAQAAGRAGARRRRAASATSRSNRPWRVHAALAPAISVIILRDGTQTFAAIFAAMRAAQHYLYLEYYTLEDVQYQGAQLSDVLIERQRAGVQIDVLYDTVGSISTPHEFFERLAAAGVQRTSVQSAQSAHASLFDQRARSPQAVARGRSPGDYRRSQPQHALPKRDVRIALGRLRPP